MTNVRLVGPTHYLCREYEFEEAPDPLPRAAARFWNTYSLGDGGCDRGVCATRNRELVGFFRFSIRVGIRPTDPATLFAHGTWVQTDCRKDGLGKAMWMKAIRWARKRYGKVRVHVTTKTAAGKALVYAVKRDARMYVLNELEASDL